MKESKVLKELCFLCNDVALEMGLDHKCFCCAKADLNDKTHKAVIKFIKKAVHKEIDKKLRRCF